MILNTLRTFRIIVKNNISTICLTIAFTQKHNKNIFFNNSFNKKLARISFTIYRDMINNSTKKT